MDEQPDTVRWTANDLDRCQHGRHVADACFGCPGGFSAGNIYLDEGSVIGHNIWGQPIVVRGWRRDVGRAS